MERYAIARHINGISLNGGIEFALGEAGGIKTFASEDQAKSWLVEQGASPEEMEFFYLIDGIEKKYRFLDGETWLPSKWKLSEWSDR